MREEEGEGREGGRVEGGGRGLGVSGRPQSVRVSRVKVLSSPHSQYPVLSCVLMSWFLTSKAGNNALVPRSPRCDWLQRHLSIMEFTPPQRPPLTVEHALPQLLHVVPGDALRVGQHHRHVLRHTHLCIPHTHTHTHVHTQTHTHTRDWGGGGINGRLVAHHRKALSSSSLGEEMVEIRSRRVPRFITGSKPVFWRAPFRLRCCSSTHALRPHLEDLQVGVGADDCTAAEVHTLARQVAAEATLLALEPLHKAPARVEVRSRMATFIKAAAVVDYRIAS